MIELLQVLGGWALLNSRRLEFSNDMTVTISLEQMKGIFIYHMPDKVCALLAIVLEFQA